MARDFVRKGVVNSTVLTAVPMFVGGGLLMLVAPVEVMPPLPELGIVAWLAIINSALAYMLWNHALKRLQAFEISIVGNLMPIGTALIAPLMLGETVPARAWVGIAVALAGVMLVGVAGDRPAAVTAEGVDVAVGEEKT
jgi:drug/metabolite transporter (DMT)-like permease